MTSDHAALALLDSKHGPFGFPVLRGRWHMLAGLGLEALFLISLRMVSCNVMLGFRCSVHIYKGRGIWTCFCCVLSFRVYLLLFRKIPSSLVAFHIWLILLLVATGFTNLPSLT